MQKNLSEPIGRRWGATLDKSVEAAIVPVYIGTIALAEWLGAYGNPFHSFIYYMALLVILLGQYALMDPAPYRQLLPMLALVPLLRILSLAVPVRFVPAIYWYVLIGVPLLLAIAQTARLLKITPDQLGLRLRAWPAQLAIACAGVPLGLAAFLILRPKPLVRLDRLDPLHVIVDVAILLVFVGFTEELLFRGLIQHGANRLFGSLGIGFSSLLTAIMYAGSFSATYVLFIGVVSLFFGWCARRTGSIWGVALAHGFLACGLILAWPLAQRRVGAEQFEQIAAPLMLPLWLLLALGIGFAVLALSRQIFRALRSWMPRQSG